MKLSLVRETNPLPFHALAATDPNATVFHLPGFLEALAVRYPEFHPAHLLAEDDAGHLLGILPGFRIERTGMSQLLSLPFGSYGTPLLKTPASVSPEEVLAALITRWGEEARASGIVRAHFIPWFAAGPHPARRVLPPEWRRSEQTHLIPLDRGFETIWFTLYDKENRTAARKSVKAGVVVTAEDGEEGAEILDQLYRPQAREWTGHALYRYGLFHELLARLPEQTRIWVARHHDEPVFAVLAFYHRGVVLPWVSGATASARGVSAGNLIHKVIIEDGCLKGYTTYNFGGSGGVAGIEAFKVAFGGMPVEYDSWFREAPWFGRLRSIRRRLLHWIGRE